MITTRARPRRGTLACIAAALTLALVVAACSDGDDDATGTTDDGVPAFPATRPAEEPFGGFEEASLTIGDEMLRVLVAVTDSQRSEGLRGVEDLGDYAGMAFVYSQPTVGKARQHIIQDMRVRLGPHHSHVKFLSFCSHQL